MDIQNLERLKHFNSASVNEHDLPEHIKLFRNSQTNNSEDDKHVFKSVGAEVFKRLHVFIECAGRRWLYYLTAYNIIQNSSIIFRKATSRGLCCTDRF